MTAAMIAKTIQMSFKHALHARVAARHRGRVAQFTCQRNCAPAILARGRK